MAIANLGVAVHDDVGYFTLSEVSDRLGISPTLLRTMCEKGEVKGAIKVKNKFWIIPCSVLKEVVYHSAKIKDNKSNSIALGKWSK